MKSKILGLLAVGLLAGPMAAQAALITYNFNFVTPQGPITGQFVADDAPLSALPGSSVAGVISSFSLFFGGVAFDSGSLQARANSSYTDWTGLNGTVTSSTTAGASLFINTCNFISCQAIWSGIPGIPDQSYTGSPQVGAVSRAVPEPTTLALLGLGLVGIGLRRRIKAS